MNSDRNENFPRLEDRQVKDVAIDTKNKIEEHQAEVAQDQLNRIDIDLLSHESIQLKSRATLRLLLVILVQGLSKSHNS
jgi:hypothetical protein